MVDVEKSHIRKANQSDLELLLLWANDDDVRKNAFSEKKISIEEHTKWFDRIMSDPNELQFIYEYEGIPIGQIRFSIDGDKGEIDYSIDKDYRGKGHGKALLNLLLWEIKRNYPNVKYLQAKVKPNNLLSIEAFKQSGYENKYLMMELVLNDNH